MIVPRLCEGSGTIRCQHGILPVPVPAVSNIVSAHQLKLHITSVQGELITPTGAAIVAAFLTSEKLPEDFTVEKIGIGAGKRQYECPGILRAMLIRESEEEASGNDACTEIDTIIKLESNIDDCTGETLGYVMELLYEAGAREANYMPVFMKKNRPEFKVDEQHRLLVEAIINNDEKGAEQYMSEHMEIIEKCMDEMQKNSNNKRPANGIVIGGE